MILIKFLAVACKLKLIAKNKFSGKNICSNEYLLSQLALMLLTVIHSASVIHGQYFTLILSVDIFEIGPIFSEIHAFRGTILYHQKGILRNR